MSKFLFFSCQHLNENIFAWNYFCYDLQRCSMCYQVLNFEFMHVCIGLFNTQVWFSHNVLQRYVWSYIVPNPVCRTAQSALHVTLWHTCWFRHQRDFSGKHSACCKYYVKTVHSRVCMLQSPSIATNVYSWVNWAWWRERTPLLCEMSQCS